ncbi:unnamed protein product [Effrenium voratum]|nr:unnamed protein product [Effrenium voratum]
MHRALLCSVGGARLALRMQLCVYLRANKANMKLKVLTQESGTNFQDGSSSIQSCFEFLSTSRNRLLNIYGEHCLRTALIAFFYLNTRFKQVHYAGICLILCSCLVGVLVELQGPAPKICAGLDTGQECRA